MIDRNNKELQNPFFVEENIKKKKKKWSVFN